ncbi:MAG: hypothetical protein ABI824_19245 [Acidobacteriota bacterium]
MKATIYIPDDKAAIYEKAKEKLGGTISATFLRCIESELASLATKTDRLVVVEWDKAREVFSKKAFNGRWIVGDGEEGSEFYFDQEKTGVSGGGNYSVAITAKGRIAVYEKELKERNPGGTLDHYKNFEELQGEMIDNQYPRYPESLIAAVADNLGIDHVEELDI